MPTNKNLICRRSLSSLALAVVMVTAGCGPPGPRALLEGKHLIDRGQYAAAVEKLNTATVLMATNAQAWNYLGLACHLAGQPDAAATAYQKALRLDHDLVITHFNLGCLWLEQNQPDKLEGARNELTAFTLHQGNSPVGWVKLGTVELRQRDTAAAEKCFWQSLQLNSNNPEALNGLGLVELQNNRHRDAVACFENALAQQPDYGPSLLNLAIIAQSVPSERQLAVQKYRQYLALNPKPANWDAVNTITRQLEQELVVASRPAAEATAVPVRTAPSNPVRPTPAATVARNETTSVPTVATEANPDTVKSNPPEVVQVQSQPVVHVAASSNVPPPRPTSNTARVASSTDDVVVVTPPADDTAPGDTPRSGFFQRMNPFHREPATVQTPGPVAENNPTGTSANGSQNNVPAPRVARYTYVSPPKPAEGNRAQAERYFAQATEAQHDHELQDAERLYRAAAQADPAFFEAQSNLGLSAYGLGDMTQALLAYEFALAIKPDSFNARFNFALALSKANYIVDAAQELERLLAASSNETPEHLAMVHLTLANLYSAKFNRPAAAKPHYQKVLELDPQNSQATIIRYWLRDHP